MMSQKERSTAILLGICMAVGITLYVGYSFYAAITEHATKIDSLTEDIKGLEAQIKTVQDGRPILNHWKMMSLGADVDRSKTFYRTFLEKLLRDNLLLIETFPDNQAPTKSNIVLQTPKDGKQPIYTGLVFQFRARCKMLSLARFLEAFQRAPYMHRIKSLTIERPDNISKKEPEMITIAVTTEALIILDAEKEKLQKKPLDYDVRFVKAAMMESAGAMRRGGFGSTPGLALMAWSASPWGPYLTPLNPPLSPKRDYAALAERNMFTGGELDDTTRDGLLPPSDLMINRMRFNRFIGLTMESDGKYEAQLWDMSTNIHSRIRTSAAFNKIPLVQSGPMGLAAQQNTLLRAVVTKIEERKIIMKIALNSTDTNMRNPKWWRYPDDGSFYRLEAEDLAKLENAGRLSESTNTAKLVLIGSKSWDKYIKDEKLRYDPKTKAFQFLIDYSRGYVIHDEADVMVVQFSGWTSFTPKAPTLAFDRLYPNPDKIYDIQSKHFDALLADAPLQNQLQAKLTTGKVKEEDFGRMYVIHKDYWEWLFGDKLITTANSGATFYMYHQFIKGDVIVNSAKSDVVVIRLADKYCHNPGDTARNIAPLWHEGYCVLMIDQKVEEARYQPLPIEEVKKIKALSNGER